MKRVLVVALLGALAAACGNGGSASHAKASDSSFGVIGDIKVDAATASILGKNVAIGDPCTSGSGFEDIRAGTQVVVADEAGKTVALGELDSGTIAGHPGQDVFTLKCLFTFEIPNVPSGHPFYRVSVGRRGGQQFTAAEIQRPIHLTLA